MSEELRLCPFCGGEAHECLDNHFDCLNPGCPMAGARAIPLENWNTRPIEDALTARIAELKPIIDKLVEGIDSLTSGFPLEIEYIEAVEIAKDWKTG